MAAAVMGTPMRQLILVLLVAAIGTAEPLVASGSRIAFLGDSITAQGAAIGVGYVNLVVSGLAANGVTVEAVPAGVSGNTSVHMLARLGKDVLEKKPAWMTLSCGVNDVWHGDKGGVKLDAYQANITAIVDQAQAAGVRVVVLTATMIYEDPSGRFNKQAVAYNEFLRAFAAERRLPLADLSADMVAAVQALPAPLRKLGNRFTTDGVHMNLLGNRLMAEGVLRAMGLDDAGIAKARAGWDGITTVVPGKPRLTVADCLRVIALADAAGVKPDDMIGILIHDALQARKEKP